MASFEVTTEAVGGKPSSSGRYGNQDGSIHSLVPSVRRATDRNNPQRMFGPVVVLDGNGFRDETDRFQRLLQRVPLSCGAEGRNADRDSGIERRRAETLSLAETLPRLIPNTNCCMRTNSPWTRRGPWISFRSNWCQIGGAPIPENDSQWRAS
jgi:hypothetical protein